MDMIYKDDLKKLVDAACTGESNEFFEVTHAVFVFINKLIDELPTFPSTPVGEWEVLTDCYGRVSKFKCPFCGQEHSALVQNFELNYCAKCGAQLEFGRKHPTEIPNSFCGKINHTQGCNNCDNKDECIFGKESIHEQPGNC